MLTWPPMQFSTVVCPQQYVLTELEFARKEDEFKGQGSDMFLKYISEKSLKSKVTMPMVGILKKKSLLFYNHLNTFV